MVDVSGLESAVAAEGTVDDSVLVFLQGLKDQLSAVLAGEVSAQAKVDAAMDAIIANSAKMSAAITATP